MANNVTVKGKSPDDSYDKYNNIRVNSDGSINANIDSVDIGNEVDVNVLNVDSTTNAISNIDFANTKTHDGKHFKAGYMNEDLDENDTLEVLFITPNTTEWAHWTLTAEVIGYVKIEIFEDTVTTDNGTAINRLNRNRNSLIESSTLAFHTPTIDTVGTKIITKFLGSLTDKKASTGDNFVTSNHLLLKQNTKYLLRMTSKLDNTIGKLGGDWYEHTNL